MLLSENERHRVLVEFNSTDVPIPQNKSFLDLFARRLELFPDAVGVIFEDIELTYQELDERANRLANHLIQDCGVTSEEIVGIHLPRSPDFIVAFLATLKAGAAFMPLDPGYPRDRLLYMLADSGTRIVITGPRGSADLPDGVSTVVEQTAYSGSSVPAPRVALHLDQLAYLIYTSGSTGPPKGVEVTHRSVVALSVALREGIHAGVGDRVLQFSSISFDASVWELLMALASGAALVISPADPPGGIETFLRAKGVTHLTLPPSVLAWLEPDDLPKIRLCVSAGEACTPAIAERWATHTRLVNAYGPTEATVCAAMGTVGLPGIAEDISIGRPIANTRIYLLDEALRPVPPGVVGELYIGGAGLARGYHGRPALTATRFVASPFGPPGERLYRTGDVGSWNTDGTIQYRGRVDQQVKIRGHRVEPGEIEHALASHPSVAHAVVTTYEPATGGTRLAAFVTPIGRPVDSAELRNHLLGIVPAYMIPSIFSWLEVFPLTPNGKIDKHRLIPESTILAADYTAPRTAAQVALAGIWGELLKIPVPGIHHNFFELGGDSLLAMNMIGRVRAQCKVTLSLRDLYRTPTIAKLSRLLETAITEQADEQNLLQVSAQASFAQEGMWKAEQLHPQAGIFNLPVVVRLRGPLDRIALRDALVGLASRHPALRTSLHQQNDGLVQRVNEDVTIDLAIVGAQQPEGWLHSLLADPFDLGTAPLLRTALVMVGDNEHLLILVLHHAIADARSIEILLDDLAVGYGTNEHNLADLDFAHIIRHRSRLDEPGFAETQAYWLRQLDGAPTLIELPFDRPRPAVSSPAAGMVPITLSPAQVAELNIFSRTNKTTLFTTLLTGFAILLSRHNGALDVIIGTAVSERVGLELEDLVGPLVNMLPMRIDLTGDPTSQQLIDRTRQTVQEALAHGDMPFERLIKLVDPVRGAGHAPLVQVTLNLYGAGGQALRLPGIESERLEWGTGYLHHDLSISLWEREDGSLSGSLGYRCDLFDATMVERWRDRYLRLLDQIVTQPDSPVSALSILSHVDERGLATFSAGPRADLTEHLSFASLFATEAKRIPDAVAVRGAGTMLTFRELNERANWWAQYLLAEHKVRPDTVVGLCLPRTPELLAVLLGILKAGAAYLPLDPSFPHDRLNHMVNDSGAHLVITTAALRPRFLAEVPTIDVTACPGRSATDLCVTTTPDHLAYLIYTSGSTGPPKGVEVTRGGLANYLSWACRTYAIKGWGGAVVATSVAYDMAVTSLLVPLLSGESVELIPEVNEDTDAAVGLLLDGPRRGILKLTPSHFKMLAEHHQDVPPSEWNWPRYLILGGEALAMTDLAPWESANHPSIVINEYGPTETVVGCCVQELTETSGNNVSIGRPIANTRIYLLDEALRPVPPGVVGELYIGGAGLARGYHGRPALTATRFVASPFGPPGERLYRTGDVGSWNTDGTIQYRGRVDQQVKIRGHRVEPGEIEHALASHPSVAHAVVNAQEWAPGHLRLEAFIIPVKAPVEAAVLRDHLARIIPSHMIPNSFTWLESFPLTPNGKIDKSRLISQTDSPSPVLTTSQTSTQAALVDIWGKLLNISAPDIHQNFFEAGGDSLLLIQFHRQAQESLGRELSIVEFFRNPSLYSLGRALEGPPSSTAVRTGLHRADARLRRGARRHLKDSE